MDGGIRRDYRIIYSNYTPTQESKSVCLRSLNTSLNHASLAIEPVTVSYHNTHTPWFGHTGLSEVRRGKTERGYIHWSYSSWKILSVAAAGQSKAQNREKRSKRKSAQKHVWNKIECKTKISKQWKRWEKKDCCQSSITAYLCGTAEVIIIDLFYCLEVDHTLQLGLMFVCGKEKQRGFVLKTKTHWRQQTFLGMKSQGTSLPRHLE